VSNHRTSLAAILVAGALLVGCTAGDDTASEDTSGASDTTAGSTPVATGPAPGVTDDSITVGVTYVDLASLGDVVNISHGDYELAYQALFDDINAEGGINGRTIDPVIVGINPVGTEAADAACVELTEDEDAFIVMGFFLADAVTCVVNTHETAVIGGSMNAELLDQARAPWYTTEAGTDVQTDVIRAMADAGEFDGTLGVFAGAGDAAQMNDVVLPLLDELGVEVAESAAVDAPPDDIAAVNAATGVIAERFDASGVDQVLTVGQSGLAWASGTESLDYRPQLLLTDPNSILAYAGDTAGRDLSVLDDAVAGNLYGGAENIYNLPAMQECIGVIEDAGGEVPEPATLEEGMDLYVSAFTACQNVTLLRALLEAAGEDLNYGSLAAGAEGLEVQLPGDPEPDTYGSPPAADGDRAAYLYDWDPDELDFVIRED
jgi:Periplasmic binding protein